MLFSDEQLMVQLIEEDNFEAFEELLNRYEKPLFNFLAKSLDNYHAAQDCFQEVFYRIYKHRKTYNPDFKFKSWLYRIAHNLCIDEIRKKTYDETGIAQNELQPELFNSCSPETRLIRDDMEEKISSLVRGLPEKLRTVLILSQYEKFQLSEIAALLSIPEGTVKSRLSNAFKRLILLAEQGGLLDDLR